MHSQTGFDLKSGCPKFSFSPEIWVGHDPEGCEGREDEYLKYRKPTGEEFENLVDTIDNLWFQRNYLK